MLRPILHPLLQSKRWLTRRRANPQYTSEELLSTLKHRLGQHTRAKNHHPQATNAAVLIAITNEADPKVLLTKRSMLMNNHRGEVSFPGGKRDPADTSNIVVALREAHEEVGLSPFDVELLGELPPVRSKSGLSVKAIIGLIPPDVTLIAEPAEIDRIFFVPLSYFLTQLPTAHHASFRGKQYTVPSYQTDGEVIWGLTGLMLTMMLQQGLGHTVDWPMLMFRPRKMKR